jgi:hypothetical protein
MGDRWAVAYEPDDDKSGKFILARHREDEIAVFNSKRAAQCWFNWTCSSKGLEPPETIYIRIPEKP